MISSLSDVHMSLHQAPYVLPVLSVHTVVHRQLHRRQGFTAARPRCTVAQVLSAAASSLQPVQTPTLTGKDVCCCYCTLAQKRKVWVQFYVLFFTCAESTELNNQGDISPSQLRSLWDGVGKPLLRVGKGGVQVLFLLLVSSFQDLQGTHRPICA